jgi:hypothetical protein
MPAKVWTLDGTWRPDTPFTRHDGLKVTMRHSPGLTRRGVLAVPLRFQVPPIGDFQRPYQFNWSTYDTISAGQRSRPMGSQLLEVSFGTMLMDRLAAEASSGVVVWSGAPDPQRMLDELRYIAGMHPQSRDRPSPFRLTVTQQAVWDAPVINMIATLTSVQPTQQAGDVATESLSLTFLEYPESATAAQRRADKPERIHTLRAGDDLYELAKRYLHRASSWRLIAGANGIRGVSPGSASELAKWAAKHHKPTLVIPRVVTTTSGVRTP